LTLGLTSLHPHAIVPSILSDEGERIVLPAFFQRSRDSPDKTRQTFTTAHRVGPTTPKQLGALTVRELMMTSIQTRIIAEKLLPGCFGRSDRRTEPIDLRDGAKRSNVLEPTFDRSRIAVV
jgi:hypothetical protein